MISEDPKDYHFNLKVISKMRKLLKIHSPNLDISKVGDLKKQENCTEMSFILDDIFAYSGITTSSNLISSYYENFKNQLISSDVGIETSNKKISYWEFELLRKDIKSLNKAVKMLKELII